jgi:hypothetical protein
LLVYQFIAPIGGVYLIVNTMSQSDFDKLTWKTRPFGCPLTESKTKPFLRPTLPQPTEQTEHGRAQLPMATAEHEAVIGLRLFKDFDRPGT